MVYHRALFCFTLLNEVSYAMGYRAAAPAQQSTGEAEPKKEVKAESHALDEQSAEARNTEVAEEV